MTVFTFSDIVIGMTTIFDNPGIRVIVTVIAVIVIGTVVVGWLRPKELL